LYSLKGEGYEMAERLEALRSELESYLDRVRDMIERARSYYPDIRVSDIVGVLETFESRLTDLTIMVAATSPVRSISIYPVFEEKERRLRRILEELKTALMQRNLIRSASLLSILRTRFYEYLRSLAFLLRTAPTPPPELEGLLSIPKGLSSDALRVLSYLRYNLEAELMELATALGMTEEEVNRALRELEDKGYVDLFMRGGVTIVRIKGEW